MAGENTRMEEEQGGVDTGRAIDHALAVRARNEKSTRWIYRPPAAATTWPGFHVHRAGPVNGLYPGRPAIYVAYCTGVLANEHYIDIEYTVRSKQHGLDAWKTNILRIFWKNSAKENEIL